MDEILMYKSKEVQTSERGGGGEVIKISSKFFHFFSIAPLP